MVDHPSAERPRARIQDVALQAGVSITTVSHAINGKGRVDPATKARVLQIASDLGYKANPIAVNLLRRRTGILALTTSVAEGASIGFSDLDFTVRFVTSATATALENGYALIIVGAHGGTSLHSLSVDGGIVIDPLAADHSIGALARRGIPVVTSGRDPSQPADSGWWVDNDIEDASVRLLDHLAKSGARRVGMIAPPNGYSYTDDYRRGYEKWCRRHRQRPMIEIAGTGVTESAAFDGAVRLLSRPDRPDAVYAALDRYALAVLLAASSLGLSVPGELLLGAGIDSDVIRSASPPVTAVELHPDQVGSAAVDLLLKRIESAQAPPEHMVVPSTIHERASSVGLTSAVTA